MSDELSPQETRAEVAERIAESPCALVVFDTGDGQLASYRFSVDDGYESDAEQAFVVIQVAQEARNSANEILSNPLVQKVTDDE